MSRYREQGMEGTMSMLQRTSTSLDRTIQALELQIQTFWKDDDVSSLLVAPEKPDFSRTSGVAAQIQGLREGNELIERCWLYLYQSGQILTDRQLLLEAGDPERPGQLERWSAAAESGTPSLWCEDGKIYLLVAFPQPKKLGLLIVQLSARDLFEQFQEGWSGLSGDPVYVYDGAGEPVFPNRMTYPEREELMVTEESPREGAVPSGTLPAGSPASAFQTVGRISICTASRRPPSPGPGRANLYLHFTGFSPALSRRRSGNR